jgi:glycosyltransferase involved in cell wall biosynthesis
MKVLVRPHSLTVGGSQIAAVDLAAGVRDLGHDVVVFGPKGPLEEAIAAHSLTFLAAPDAPGAPHRSLLALRKVVRERDIDLVHAYEQSACMHAFYVGAVLERRAVVGSILSLQVPWYLPTELPIVVGTDKKARDFRYRWPHDAVTVVPAPVDTDRDHPSVDASAFRREHGLDDDRFDLVVASRLVDSFKVDGLELAIAAVGRLASEMRVRLVIVGDGDARPKLQAQADEVNRRAGDRVIVLVGEVVDPRPAYAAADAVIGGGQALVRGMAFEKPGIVVGREGFVELVTPDNADVLDYHGFFGVGGEGGVRFDAYVRRLATDGDERVRLGRFARELVQARLSLRSAAQELTAVYERARRAPVPRAQALTAAAVTPARSWRYRMVRKRLAADASSRGLHGDAADIHVRLGLAEAFAPGNDFMHWSKFGAPGDAPGTRARPPASDPRPTTRSGR